MRAVFSPSDPGRIELQLTMTATVKEWSDLATAISEKVNPEGVARCSTPAIEFVSMLSRMINQAKGELVSDRHVSAWTVVKVEAAPAAPAVSDQREA